MFETVVVGFLLEIIFDHCPCAIRLENQIDKKRLLGFIISRFNMRFF